MDHHVRDAQLAAERHVTLKQRDRLASPLLVGHGERGAPRRCVHRPCFEAAGLQPTAEVRELLPFQGRGEVWRLALYFRLGETGPGDSVQRIFDAPVVESYRRVACIVHACPLPQNLATTR